ncbi:MAG: hypothetical protein RLY86_650 [Pseudomonadota bacterium]|jgi:microcystin-dependent protein
MTDYYIGEIRLWPISRIPVDFHACDGSLLPINEYQPLYALIGTTYGGDGHSTFALPDLRGRLPVGTGQRPNNQAYVLGQVGGVNAVTLTAGQLPTHTHSLQASKNAATSLQPGGNMLADPSDDFNLYVPFGATQPTLAMSTNVLDPAGGGQAHENRMPSFALNYIIALNGLFPSRN